MTADPTQGATQAETAGLRTIERTAEEHPGVGRAAATIDTDRFGNERLAVHAEPAGAVPPPTSGELRLFLAGRLPEAVQPDAVTVLESLPSDSAGRIDYTALPAASADVPRSVHAALLQDMFAAVVGLPAVDPKDNFFDIGGHSLLATRPLWSRMDTGRYSRLGSFRASRNSFSRFEATSRSFRFARLSVSPMSLG